MRWGLWFVIAGGCGASLLGCAGTPEPLRVRYADLANGAARDYKGDRPLVVEFEPGDRIPVDFRFSGQYFGIEPTPAVDVVTTGHCFVRFGGDGIKVSADGRNFDERPQQPGSFRIGLHSERDKPTKLEVFIATPRR
jgi:hypothetical protein